MNDLKTVRRKSVKQKCRNLHSETAETCTVTQEQPINSKVTLRCDYCGKYTKDSDLTTVWIADKYLMCRKCRGNDWPCLCANGEEQVVESVSSPPYRANYCGLCGRFIGGDYA